MEGQNIEIEYRYAEGKQDQFPELAAELVHRNVDIIKETVPKVSRVAVLYDPGSGSEREVKETLPFAARALSLTVRPWIVRKAADFDSVFTEMSKERPDGLYVPARGPLITKNEQKIANFALGNRLPSVYSYGAGVEAGGLLYYGADLTDLYQRVVIYVDRIIKGTKPADLPVEQPTKFELIINLRTAQQIGLAIPPNILARADRVIR
jgi:putative ABC transport system substrate-binding protein